MKVVLPRQSLEYVSFPLSTAPIDPSALTHEVAIVAVDAQPATADWFTATFTDGKVEVLVQASPDAESGGDVTLAVGRWRIWWRAESNPEYPVRPVGVLTVV